MKILIVNSYDIKGGAARAAYRLQNALKRLDIDSKMIVQRKISDDQNVLVCKDDWESKSSFYDKMPLLDYSQKTSTLFSTASIPNSSLIKLINESDADIAHFHWITNGFLSIEDIAQINKPIVWSLHDMWAFTGGCHYDEECGGYENECGNCNVLRSNQKDDLSKKIFLRKQKTFTFKKDITIVGLSRWMNNCSKNSTLLKDNNHINLPNPIDTNIFKPLDKKIARELWNLPQNKRLVLFGAMEGTSNLRKGFKELSEALHNLTCKDIEFVVFGNSEPKDIPNFGFKTHYFSHINDDVGLVALYSAVDVIIVPSLQENLSNAIMESLACATPVVAFDIGGNADMVEHKINGYLSKPFDAMDLKNGIEWILYASDYKTLCKNAREKVVREFDSIVVGEKYVELYKSIVKEQNQHTNLQYRSNHRMKFITPSIEKWFQDLASQQYDYIIYGYGNFAMGMLDYFADKIIAFVDQASDRLTSEIIKGEVYNPKNLPNMKYEKIIISVLGREKEIERYLIDQIGVSREKIVKFVI